VAVWGAGPHAVRRIIPALVAATGAELYGVCSRSAEALAHCASTWGCRTWSDAGAMLDDAGVEVVYVATPSGLHAAHGRRVLEAGRHLWCEKPITTRHDDTLALLDLSRRHGRSVCEAFMYLHHPQFRQVEEYVRERLGRVLTVGSRFGIPTLAHPGFRDDPALGGGALFDVGCYPVSAVVALFPGEDLVVECARVGSRDGHAVDTDGHAIIRISNGAAAHLEWRTHAAYRNELFVWGERGSLSTDLIYSKPETHVPTFELRDATGAASTATGAAANHFVAMLEAFAAAARQPDEAEAERGRIARRAGVLQEIWKGRQ
jgi:predicted dehydrogenase